MWIPTLMTNFAHNAPDDWLGLEKRHRLIFLLLSFLKCSICIFFYIDIASFDVQDLQSLQFAIITYCACVTQSNFHMTKQSSLLHKKVFSVFVKKRHAVSFIFCCRIGSSLTNLKILMKQSDFLCFINGCSCLPLISYIKSLFTSNHVVYKRFICRY